MDKSSWVLPWISSWIVSTCSAFLETTFWRRPYHFFMWAASIVPLSHLGHWDLGVYLGCPSELLASTRKDVIVAIWPQSMSAVCS